MILHFKLRLNNNMSIHDVASVPTCDQSLQIWDYIVPGTILLVIDYSQDFRGKLGEIE